MTEGALVLRQAHKPSRRFLQRNLIRATSLLLTLLLAGGATVWMKAPPRPDLQSAYFILVIMVMTINMLVFTALGSAKENETWFDRILFWLLLKGNRGLRATYNALEVELKAQAEPSQVVLWLMGLGDPWYRMFCRHTALSWCENLVTAQIAKLWAEAEASDNFQRALSAIRELGRVEDSLRRIETRDHDLDSALRSGKISYLIKEAEERLGILAARRVDSVEDVSSLSVLFNNLNPKGPFAETLRHLQTHFEIRDQFLGARVSSPSIRQTANALLDLRGHK